jgi:hypothetical protein
VTVGQRYVMTMWDSVTERYGMSHAMTMRDTTRERLQAVTIAAPSSSYPE